MGTTWSLSFLNPRMLPLAEVRLAIEAALARVVAQMSHWEHDSDLARFNRAPAGSRQVLPTEFATVLACALQWAEASGNAIDPTVGPLVACWGFGPDAHNHPPSFEELNRARARTGWHRLDFDARDRSLRQPGAMMLDLSGIAKGFAVDHGVDALCALGLADLLFEIGGELRGLGRRPGGARWQLQIEGDTARRVPLADMAIATSGDRWQRHEHGDRHWSHTIDPRTGEPVTHALASVTVLHAECMQADALATVLTVLGPEEGLAFANRHDIAALLITHEDATPGAPRARATRAWQALIAQA